MTEYATILAGDPAPRFTQRTPCNPRYVFDTAAGRYLVLCFLGSAADRHAQAALRAVGTRPAFFDDVRGCFFGVTVDPADETEGRVVEQIPGYRFFLDLDMAVSRAYGVAPAGEPGPGGVQLRRGWFVLDPTLRVIEALPFREDGSDIAALLACLDALPPPERFAGFEVPAPILVLPRVFEPAFCARLIELYEADGGEDSGFVRDVGGKTVLVTDHAHKRRRDHTLTDEAAIAGARARVLRRVVPEIARVHAFHATRMERYIVGCYTAEDGGHFRPHRDNTTAGTAHRRFAVSINLNEDFDGGEVSFPEYSRRGFKAPAGGAVIFSCSLLHTVSRVTRGRRYAFLPFLYDDAAARVRAANNPHLGAGIGAYRGTAPERKKPEPPAGDGAPASDSA